MAPPSVRCLGAVRECAANPRFACADPLFAQAELIVPGKSVAPKASGTERASGGTVTFRDAAFTLYVRLKRCCCVPTIHSPQPLPTSTATSRRRHLVASTSVGEASRGKLWSACVHAASARSARLMPTSLPRCGSLRGLHVWPVRHPSHPLDDCCSLLPWLCGRYWTTLPTAAHTPTPR